jgi:hypothetical protein
MKKGVGSFKNFLFQKHWANFNHTLHKSSLGGKWIQVCSKEGDSPSPRGDNSERVKIHWKFLKVFFSKTSGSKLIKLGTYYPWVKEIQVWTNKGPGPLQRVDNHKNVKIGWDHLKILKLRTVKPEKLNFTWKLSDMEQRQVDYIMGPRGSNGGNDMHIIFLYGPRLLRWAMWPMELLFRRIVL